MKQMKQNKSKIKQINKTKQTSFSFRCFAKARVRSRGDIAANTNFKKYNSKKLENEPNKQNLPFGSMSGSSAIFETLASGVFFARNL